VVDCLHVLATALGADERGRAVEAALAPRLTALRARNLPPLSAVSYTNLGTGGWVAGSGTTADILFALVGLENAAARAHLVGHREIDLEGLLSLAPDVIVVGAPDEKEGIVSTRATSSPSRSWSPSPRFAETSWSAFPRSSSRRHPPSS